MKARMSSAGMKGLFVQHSEKLILGLTVLLLGFFFWSAFRLSPLPATKSPSRLAQLAESADLQTKNSTPPANQFTTPKWVDLVEQGTQPISVGAYAFATEFDRPKVPAIVKRPDPPLFPLEDLQATAVLISVPVQPGVQAPVAPVQPPPVVADKAGKSPPNVRRPPRGGGEEGGRIRKRPPGRDTSDDGGGPPVKAAPVRPETVAVNPAEPVRNGAQVNNMQGEVRNAVVLVGRIPYAKQLQEFQSRFSDAVMPPGHTLDKDIPEYVRFKLERQEISGGTVKPWVELDVEAAWRDQVRWGTVLAEVVATPYVDQVTTWPMPPTLARDWGRLATHPSIPLANAVDMTAAEQIDAATQPGEGPFGSRRPNLRTNNGEGLEGGRGLIGEGRQGEVASSTLQAHVPYFLFRYVDWQALESGKQYRYRVALQLSNPNFQISPGLLENIASQTTDVRWTPASEPSPTVTIGREKRLLATAIKYGKSFSETVASFQIHLWDRKRGFEIASTLTTPLGGIVDLVDKVTTHMNPALGYAVEDLGPYAFRFDPRTEAGPPLFADARGGVPMAGGSGKADRVNQPIELMFFDTAGRVIFTTEALDSPDAKFYDARYTDRSGAVPAGGNGLLEGGEGPSLLRQPPARRPAASREG